MPRGRSEQRRQNKEQHPIGHHRNKEKPYGVATERSFDGKGDAADEEQHRQHRLKAKKELASFTLWHLRSPRKNPPQPSAGMIQGYRLAGKGFPPKAEGHVSQPVQLKSKAKNSD